MTDRIKRMLRLPEVLVARGNISKSKHYSDIRAGRFPKPIKLSTRVSAWTEEDVVTEQREKIAERDRATA
jgi:prophage regulatory protein